ncbi:hypothetical protein NL676_023583, partial [Syzygium grande]
MVGSNLFQRRKHSWPPEEYISRGTLQLFDFDSAAPPEHAWRRRLDSHANILKEFSVTFREAIKMVRLGIRLWSYIRKEAAYGRKAPIDPFTRESCKPSASQGVPLGGMGSGSISRGFRGEFRQWQIIPSIREASPVMANQFSIFVSRDGGNKKYASVLAPGQHEGLGKQDDYGISSWGWNLSGQNSTYHALFPRAWTIYDGEPDPDLKVSCRQISPFIPHNYKDSSLPTAVFVYTLVNTGKERAKVSLLFTWANSVGGISQLSGDHVNEPFIGEDGVSGVLLHHKTAKGNPPVTFAIAACETQNVNVTVLPSFGLSQGSCITAKDMWGTMVRDGQFDQGNFSSGPTMPSSVGEMLCAAVSASAWVESHGKCTFAFALAWSSPKVKFSKGSLYYRRYTKYYGTCERAAYQLVHDALKNYKQWEEEIEKWQNPILHDERLPSEQMWVEKLVASIVCASASEQLLHKDEKVLLYKFTLFNELYFLVAGGTIWIDSQSPDECTVSLPHATRKLDKKNVRVKGRKVDNTEHEEHFATVGSNQSDGAVLAGLPCKDESASTEDDPMDFSHSLSFLDPQNEEDDVGRFLYLEGVEYLMWCTYDVHFYASFALLELFPKIELSIQRDFAKAVLSEDGRKVRFLAEGNWGIRKVRGAVPHDLGTHDPWNEMNAYNIHDTSKWKDLNPKFVLQVYRDFSATGDLAFGLMFGHQDNDGLIENDGFPDQTYDTWTVHGVSAYCGCLWLAALQAAAAMALQIGDRDFAEWCKATFLKAKPVFEAKLWNGSYFNYDSGASSNSKSIQADQLAGQWYTASSGLPPLFDDGKIRSSLQKIYDFNVMKVRGGRMGAVNGMHPNGKVDETCMQSREIWTGVTYAVAANMILAGMEEQAFTTAEGIFIAGWSEEGYGYWFQTPEAWTIDGHFRSLIYMRPLSIWGMQWALSLPKGIMEAPQINMMDRIRLSPMMSRPSGSESGVRIVAHRAGCFDTKAYFGRTIGRSNTTSRRRTVSAGIVRCRPAQRRLGPGIPRPSRLAMGRPPPSLPLYLCNELLRPRKTMARKMLIDGELDGAGGHYDFDLFVIGAGSGGVRAARFSANYGAKVGICELPFNPISSEVDGGVGGTCVLRGCVPKKILVYGAAFGGELEDARNYGWELNEKVDFNWKKLLHKKTEEITRLNGIYKRLLSNAGVKLFEGEGKLVGPNEVEVTQLDGTKLCYSAKHILIATGSRAQRPNIPGQELGITSDEALSLEDLRKRAVVLGGGYIALPLRGFDDEMRAVVARNLEGRGINLHPRTNLTELIKTEDGIKVITDHGEELHADLVLFATGRIPNTKRLNLASVGVETDALGAVKVDDNSRTNVPSIWAVGDVTNRMNLTPVALMEGTCFAKTVFGGQPTKPDYINVPCAVFCIPPLSVVGLSEEQAIEQANGDVLVFTSTFNPMKNTVSGKTAMKLVVDAETDKVLGASMCGLDAPEIMQGIAVALKCGATKAQFDST